MVGDDGSNIFAWWLTVFLPGLIFLPLTMRHFARFFDRGYLFSKVLGIAISSYAVWLAGSAQLLPFTRDVVVISVLVLGAVTWIVWWLTKTKEGDTQYSTPNTQHPSKEKGERSTFNVQLSTFNKKEPAPLRSRFSWRMAEIAIAEELLFLGCLIFWSFIRGLQPDIQGLEKFMDFGFVNAILRSPYFPPADMWFAGKPINYYYYGHYVAAFLIRGSGVPSSVGYNLMIATLFAFTFTLIFSLGANLVYLLDSRWLRRAIVAGALAAVLVALGGNLHCYIYAHAIPALQKVGLYHGQVKPYWYPDATRYIGYNPPTNDKTIHEFPLYSFVVADLHGHVSDIPFVLTLLAALLAMLVRPQEPGGWKKVVSWDILLPGLFLAIFAMTNAWDLPIYFAATAAVIAMRNACVRSWGWGLARSTLGPLVAIIVTVFVLTLPFRRHFESFANGVGAAPARSPIYQLLVLWGYQLFFVTVLAGFCYWRYFHPGSSARRHEQDKSDIPRPDLFVLVLCLGAVGLLVAPEIVFVRDIYGKTYARANTMFKLTYQAFMLLGLIAGYTAVRVSAALRPAWVRAAVGAVFAFVLAIPLVYPFYAIKGYYGPVSRDRYRGLDGLQFLRNNRPDDYAAVLWLEENERGCPVILEANGDSYTDHGRISMATGLPTVLGWYVHEWLWRNNSKIVSARADEVATVYATGNEAAARAVIKKYGIRYIVFGKLEKAKFKWANPGRLGKFGKVVYETPSLTLYKVRDEK